MRLNRKSARDTGPGPRIGVLHVTFGLDMGGQEKLLVEFARHADRSRFDLEFVSIGFRGVLAGDIESLGWRVTAEGAPAGLRPSVILRLATCVPPPEARRGSHARPARVVLRWACRLAGPGANGRAHPARP